MFTAEFIQSVFILKLPMVSNA